MSVNRVLNGLAAGMGGMALALLVLATMVGEAQGGSSPACDWCIGRVEAQIRMNNRGVCWSDGVLDGGCLRREITSQCEGCSEWEIDPNQTVSCQGEADLKGQCDPEATGPCSAGSWGYKCGSGDGETCYEERVDSKKVQASVCYVTCKCGQP